MTRRLVAAMSGGVDSAVAAARAADAGCEVTGVHLALATGTPAGGREHGCCSPQDARDARRAADVIGIAFYVWDLAERFRRDVVDDFAAEYAAGRTPNPCLRCNERIKFAALADRAVALGFDAVVTGHYARLDGGRLHRGVDAGKDQSYVLGTLRRDQLARACFPLGASTKAEVRAEAAARGLAVADKPDSHDVCFVPDGDNAGWLRRRLGPQPGPVVDAATGEVLARHDGAYAFTVGQRRGLRLDTPAPDGRPRYVLEVSPVLRQVTVGPREALAVTGVRVAAPVFTGPPPLAPTQLVAQVRAHGTPVPALAALAGGQLHVAFDDPVLGVATGQALVLYDGDAVVGGGTMVDVHRTRPATAGRTAP